MDEPALKITTDVRRWDEEELYALSIDVQDVDFQTFFGHPQSDTRFDISPFVSQKLLECSEMPTEGSEKSVFQFWFYLQASLTRLSNPLDFTWFLLRFLGFENHDHMILRDTQMGSTIQGRDGVVPFPMGLVQLEKDSQEIKYKIIAKAFYEADDSFLCPHAQLIGEAIVSVAGDASEISQVIGIIMQNGTRPIFYKIPISRPLDAYARKASQPRPAQTIVQRLDLKADLVNPGEERQNAFQALLAVKQLICTVELEAGSGSG
ncbi:hypothetical protein BDN72DRAFT_202171 [Pluteus cervinus]|uniref:Uncharacterized protein n=1 Tax=Pluteus cervinus TaxID=181527 RepID=A0ACD3B6Z4_9AGAR|nr:hypothetical protein BDN72DRAFT_202171 [Pluteus cervinus]